MAASNVKLFALQKLGFAEEPESTPKPPPKPTGRWRMVSQQLKLIALLALFGYFAYLLIQLIVQYVEDTNDPPLKVTQFTPPRSSADPKFPAMVVCNDGYNKSLSLIQVGLKVTGNSSSDVYCYPDSTGDNCDAEFPVGSINAWRFIIRHESDSRRRVLQDDEEPEAIPPGDGSADVTCIAVNLTSLSGFQTSKRGKDRRVQALMLFSLDKAPNDPNLVEVVGLEGLNAYFFDSPEELPGAASQASRASDFSELNGSPEFVTVDDFNEDATDQVIVGSNFITYMTIAQSRTYPLAGGEIIDFAPASTLVAPINKENFISAFNPEVGVANSTIDFAFVSLSYNSRIIVKYTYNPPNFATLLGAIGGLKGIIFDFWAVALLILLYLTHVQAMRARAGAGAANGQVLAVATSGENRA